MHASRLHPKHTEVLFGSIVVLFSVPCGGCDLPVKEPVLLIALKALTEAPWWAHWILGGAPW